MHIMPQMKPVIPL